TTATIRRSTATACSVRSRSGGLPSERPQPDRSQVAVVGAALCGDELVADAAHRQQALRVARVGLELPAEIRDVHVDRPAVADELALPEMPDELVSSEVAAGLGGEQCDEPELGSRELHRLAVDSRGMACDVELEPADRPH